MSNDANETPKRGRIDLTQFEEMFSGPWRIEWLDGAVPDEEPSAINAEDYGTIATHFTVIGISRTARQAMATVPNDCRVEDDAREDMLLDALQLSETTWMTKKDPSEMTEIVRRFATRK